MMQTAISRSARSPTNIQHLHPVLQDPSFHHFVDLDTQDLTDTISYLDQLSASEY